MFFAFILNVCRKSFLFLIIMLLQYDVNVCHMKLVTHLCDKTMVSIKLNTCALAH